VGIDRRVSGPIIFILLLLIGPVGVWYAQSELNKVWPAQGTGALPQPGAAEPVPAEPRPEMPEQGPQAPSQPQ
jgi:hypothetical protein